MPRSPIAFAADDISTLAKSLRTELTTLGQVPSHVQLLNMLARATGHANFQHLRASAEAAGPAPVMEGAPVTLAPRAAEPSPDMRRAHRAAGFFDAEKRLVSWPAKTNLQELCLWALWARLPAERSFTEREISMLIESWHLFGDRALLRREMVDYGMVRRTQDGRDYRRVERKPPPELRPLLEAIG
ncbi:MAG: DUF2087 domain-containing protein [Devosia sp.]